jgi:ABC-type transport system involved in multi-copper enzyme maturation permease subunit
VAPATAAPGPAALERVLREANAIWVREMRQAARLARTPWILFALTIVLALLMSSIGGLAAESETAPAAIGGALFQVFFSLAYLVVVIVGPAVAANGIAAEREGRTWEAVLLTGLRPQDVARGKFLAAYTTISLYIVVLAPVGALSFLFGGVTATEVVVAFAFLFLVAGLAVAFGLAVSSLMSSLRGALVITLMLAIVVGPLLYLIFGFAASFGIHKIWPEVPEAFPVWLPLAYSRGKIGLDYLLLLVAVPLLAVLAPAWYLYEATVASLSGEADDRSSGYKRWFVVCAPLVAVACGVPAAVADDTPDRAALSILGLCALSLFLAFCAFLFAGEPAGPSRRVRVHWERERAGSMRRFFGPGLPKTAMLVAALGFGAVWLTAFGDMALVNAFSDPSRKMEHLEEIFFFALYAAGFFVFVTGLAAWLRSRGSSPWIARLVTAAILFFVSAAPWVVAAIGGVINKGHDDEWLVIAGPSPFYAVYVVSYLESVMHTRHVPVVEVGAACSLVWGMLGLALLGAAAHRCHRLVRERDAAVAAAEAALRAEEAAEAPARELGAEAGGATAQ